jgi:FAD/FMN-containing dehydrogenase
MADNVAAIAAILADGTHFRFGPDWPGQGAATPHVIGELMARLQTLGRGLATEIAARFPQVLRRVGGYNIDALTPAAAAAGRDNPARLLVGSEGTLAVSAALELILHLIKPRKVLGICQFPSFRAAMEATRHLVALDPEAVEFVDRTMIDLGRGIPIFREAIDRMVIGEPESVLIVEFVSRAMAEADLLPAVRKARAEELIVADGISCRRQIADLSGRVAVHSVRVLADALHSGR